MTAQITQAEIKKLKQQLEGQIEGYSIIYDKDEEGDDNFSIYQGDSGEDVFWSGSVLLQKDYYISWKFSLSDGATITEATFELNEQNNKLISNIYDVYNIWFNFFNKHVKGEAPATESGIDIPDVADMGGANEEIPEEPISETRTIKGRQNIIDSNHDRMRRLAGLK